MIKRCCGASGQDVAFLLIRLVVGAVFLFHGSQKLFGWFDGPGIEGFSAFLGDKLGMPMPALMAYLAAGGEFFGGLFVLLGLLTRLAAIPLIVSMTVAVTQVHWGRFSVADGGMEFALTMGVLALALALAGPGAISIDRLIFRGRCCANRTNNDVSTGVANDRA
ncbi:MAG: DoxX family membrane protein [Phycisphaera sp.]|nr:DoxX family membrane protein [Phycisphaera sp.]